MSRTPFDCRWKPLANWFPSPELWENDCIRPASETNAFESAKLTSFSDSPILEASIICSFSISNCFKSCFLSRSKRCFMRLISSSWLWAKISFSIMKPRTMSSISCRKLSSLLFSWPSLFSAVCFSPFSVLEPSMLDLFHSFGLITSIKIK